MQETWLSLFVSPSSRMATCSECLYGVCGLWIATLSACHPHRDLVCVLGGPPVAYGRGFLSDASVSRFGRHLCVCRVTVIGPDVYGVAPGRANDSAFYGVSSALRHHPYVS